LACFVAPVFVNVFEQVAGVELEGVLEFFEGGTGAGALLKGFGIQPDGKVWVDLQGGAFGEEQIGVEADFFEGAADAVDVLAEVAAGGSFRAERPELEGQAAAVNRLRAVKEQIGKEGTRGRRAQIEGLPIPGLGIEGFKKRGT